MKSSNSNSSSLGPIAQATHKDPWLAFKVIMGISIPTVIIGIIFDSGKFAILTLLFTFITLNCAILKEQLELNLGYGLRWGRLYGFLKNENKILWLVSISVQIITLLFFLLISILVIFFLN